jgi:signal transduction histidine kinase/CheY-like chemotaxis protein
MDELHSLLRRQLRRQFGTVDAIPKELEAIVGVVNEAYRQFDHDRRMLERTLELSSGELLQANAEIREARDASEEASRAKSRFLANMSHELRTPLNAIIGYSEMLREDAAAQGQTRAIADLKRIEGAGRHLLTLINDILDLSKIEAGKMDLYLEEFDAAALIEEVRATISRSVEENGNRFEVHCAADLGRACADITRLRQIFFNLLSNAAKFTKHGTVMLEAAREGRWLVVRVRDTGIGIGAEQLAQLFQPFTQADASTTRKYGGTGLGLVLCKRYCELMGGTIDVDSEIGKGTTFTVRLPMDGREQRPEQRPTAAAMPQSRGLVLVVDDDPATHDLAARILEGEGFATVCARSGDEAFRIAREQKPVAITLDIVMPGMSGWNVLAALKADPELASIPVIVVTFLNDQHTGYALGASDYLVKPIDRQRLVATVRRLFPNERPHHVLVVDDERDVRVILRDFLQKEGFRVSEAENGVAALKALVDLKVDLILLDLMMPELDGFGFLEQLQRRGSQTVPVIVLTAMELDAAERERLRGSVQRIVAKRGGRQDELAREIAQLLRERAR